MADLTRIVSVVEIRSIRLQEAFCRALVEPSEVAETIQVTTSHQAEILHREEPGSLRVLVRLGWEIRDRNDDETLQAEIRGTFELDYHLPDDEPFSDQELRAFSDFNAVFNAWPYWRELVQSSLARMSLPTLTVPVFRVTPREDAPDAPGEND